MKKNIIITILVIANIATIGGLCYMSKINQDNVAKYDELYNTYSETVNDYNYLSDSYNSLNDEHEELEEQVYHALEGENYDLTIDHDGATMCYTKKGKGLIKDTSKITIY